MCVCWWVDWLPLCLLRACFPSYLAQLSPIARSGLRDYLSLQTVSNVLLSALTDIARDRPFLPFSDSKTSARRVLAAILRANNPNARMFQKRKAVEDLKTIREDLSLLEKLQGQINGEVNAKEADNDESVKALLARFDELRETQPYKKS